MTGSLDLLQDSIETLLDTGNLIAIKAEFEAEGTRIDELAVLSQLCCKYKVPLTLKIGGPCAKRDIYEAFQLGASNILVPMVESRFAAESSSNTFSKFCPIFKGLKEEPSLLINIESKISIKNIDEIIDSIISNNLPIKTFVVGRSDLSSSLGIKDVNSCEMLETTKDILYKVRGKSIGTTLGGNLTDKSYDFIERLRDYGLCAYESRKCTFKNQKGISKEQFTKILNQGLAFEMAWLKYKSELYSNRSKEEQARIDTISYRIRG